MTFIAPTKKSSSPRLITAVSLISRKTPFWEGQEAFIATPEDVILKKLDFLRQGGSEKHIQDIRGILSNTEIDESYLQDWISELSLTREWGRVQ